MRLTASTTMLILTTIAAQLALADQVAMTNSTDAEARLEQLERAAAEQSERLEALQSKAEDLEARNTSFGRDAEIRRVVAEVLSDAEFREGMFPDALNAGFDSKRGFFIDSADEAFSLNIKGYVQVRLWGNNRQTDNPNRQGRQRRDDAVGFEIERLFLAFYGHIHSPKLKYRIVVDGGYTSAGRTGTEDGQWRTYFAHLDYEYLTDHYITAGLFWLPFGVQSKTSASKLQFVDRSAAAWAHYVDRSVGVMAHGNLFDRRMTYFAAITNGAYHADDSVSRDELDTNFAYTARLCYYALGKGNSLAESRGGYPQGDLAYSKDPSLRFGTSVLFNDNNGDQGTGGFPGHFASIPDRIRNGRGLGGSMTVDDLGTQYLLTELDVGFKYRGLSINVEYFLRSVDGESDFSQWELRTGRSDTIHQQLGHVQVGYFVIPKKVEVVGRVGGIWDNGNDNSWEFGTGVNYYPFSTYNCRLSADYIHISEVVAGAASGPNYGLNDEINMLRLQLQVGF